jgi:hypothetical protein
VDMKPMMVFACLLFLYFLSPVATNPHSPQDKPEQGPTVLDHNALEQQTGEMKDYESSTHGHSRQRRGVYYSSASRSILLPGSDNGDYYNCSFSGSAEDDECIFSLTSSAPADWLSLGAVEHDTSLSPCSPKCEVRNATGATLGVTPKPWTNGDNLALTETAQTGDALTYTMIFEMVAPLRNLMMYHPGQLDEATWKKYTKAFVDCKVKDVDDAEGNHYAYSVDNVYDLLKNPRGEDIHHNVLQFLEEGTIDLVCIATGLKMDRCDAIRDKWEVGEDIKCDCWLEAYNELFGVEAIADEDVITCYDPDQVSCGANEQFKTCGSSCPITCQNKGNPPQICLTLCGEGCFCREGYVRNEWTGECVLPDKCPKYPAGCRTVEGKSCVFPFNYNGREYYQCTGVDHTMMWCAVKANGDYNNDDKSWGNCDPSCSGDAATTVTTSGIPCVFPFKYKDQTYYDCTTEDFGTTNWCSVKVDREDKFITGKWGVCSLKKCGSGMEEETIWNVRAVGRLDKPDREPVAKTDGRLDKPDGTFIAKTDGKPNPDCAKSRPGDCSNICQYNDECTDDKYCDKIFEDAAEAISDKSECETKECRKWIKTILDLPGSCRTPPSGECRRPENCPLDEFCSNKDGKICKSRHYLGEKCTCSPKREIGNEEKNKCNHDSMCLNGNCDSVFGFCKEFEEGKCQVTRHCKPNQYCKDWTGGWNGECKNLEKGQCFKSRNCDLTEYCDEHECINHICLCKPRLVERADCIEARDCKAGLGCDGMDHVCVP